MRSSTDSAYRLALSDVTTIAASHTLDRDYEAIVPYGQNALGFESTSGRVDVYEIDLSDFSESFLGRVPNDLDLEAGLYTFSGTR